MSKDGRRDLGLEGSEGGGEGGILKIIKYNFLHQRHGFECQRNIKQFNCYCSE